MSVLDKRIVKRAVCLAEATKAPAEEMKQVYGDGSGWVVLQVELRCPLCLQLLWSILCVSMAMVAEHCCCLKASSEIWMRFFEIYEVS